MHAVIRTPTFLTDASTAGLSEDDPRVIVTAISKTPSGRRDARNRWMPEAAV